MSLNLWFDGRIGPQDQLAAPLTTHAMHYGTAVFEGIRSYATPDGAAVFPEIPPGGFHSEEEVAKYPGVRVINAGDVALGSTLDVYAFSRETTQRNLYKIPIP